MKKVIVLFIVFSLFLTMILLSQNSFSQTIVNAHTVSPNISDYELKCTAMGTIKQTDKIKITLKFDIVIKEFIKNVGDNVKPGETLFIIDKDKTLDILKKTYSEQEIELYRDYIDAYPTEYKSEYNAVITKINDSDIIYAEDSIIELSSGSGFIASVNVSEKEIFNIKIGQNVVISGDAFKDKTYSGRVSTIADYASEQSIGNEKVTAVNVLIDIINPDNDLKSGYNIKANIHYGTIKDAISIPYEALREDDNSFYVYKLLKNYAHKSKVDVVYEDKDCVVVNGNINKSEKICIISDSTSDTSMPVNIISEGIKY